MKAKSKALRFLFAITLVGALASIVHAGPGPQYWESLRNDKQFSQLKASEKVAYVCMMCKTVSEVAITSHEHAMEFCKEGAMVTCPSCKMESKVVMKRQRNDPASHTEVSYVNEKGEECAFVAKVVDKK